MIVVVVFAAQLLGWIFVAATILKIKNGPLTRLQNGTLPLMTSGKTLAVRGADIAARLKARTVILLHRVQAIRHRAQVMESPKGMWIEPRHLKQAAGLVALLRQKPKGIPAKKRPSVAQKLGLVPPALVRLAPLGKLARVVLQAVRQLRP